MPRGQPPKPVELKKRLGNPGKRPLPSPVTTIRPVQVAVVNGHGPTTGLELVEALMAAGAQDWIGETDALATLRLVKDAWDERRHLREYIEKEGHVVLDDRGNHKANPAVAQLRELERQLTTWLAQLGLNPADRGRLGLAQVQAKATGLAALRSERALKAGRPGS